MNHSAFCGVFFCFFYDFFVLCSVLLLAVSVCPCPVMSIASSAKTEARFSEQAVLIRIYPSPSPCTYLSWSFIANRVRYYHSSQLAGRRFSSDFDFCFFYRVRPTHSRKKVDKCHLPGFEPRTFAIRSNNSTPYYSANPGYTVSKLQRKFRF